MTMLTPDRFLLETVYLGDRLFKGFCLNSDHRELLIKIDAISRIRSPSRRWDFYTAEDIDGGGIMFTGVRSVRFEPSGPIPNNWIRVLSVTELDEPRGTLWRFEILMGCKRSDGGSQEVKVEIVGNDAHLVDPKRPGEKIRE